MYVGMRLSELAVGEPLLNIAWTHAQLTGKEAVQKRLTEQFDYLAYLGINYIIDTIKTVKKSGRLAIDPGIRGDVWTVSEKLEQYRQLANKLKINVVLEIDLAGDVTESNVNDYCQFIVQNIIARYAWVRYWIIGVNIDEQYEDGTYKCPPELYHFILKEVYTNVKRFDKDIRIGGPNVQSSLNEYIEHRSGWLAAAIGNKFNEDSKYASVGQNGILSNIDFFAFTGRGLSANNIPTVANNIRTMLFEHLGSNAISLFQTWQGNVANKDDLIQLETTAYNDLRELLTAAKNGVIPFKNELVDAYVADSLVETNRAWNSRFDSNRVDHGILQYSMITKKNYATYNFVFDAINGFTNVVRDSNVYEPNANIESITFQKDEGTLITNVTIIWPNTLNEETVVLLPASYLREYQTQNGPRTAIHDPVPVNLRYTHFLVVYEKIEQFELDESDIRLNIERRLRYQREILDQVMAELPSSYSKEVMDTNIYRLMRVVSLELAEASMHLTMVKEDGLIDNVREDAIFQNFGTLVKLEKRADWTYSKYKKLVKGLLASFLKGPTCTSVATALQLFTNFKVSICELYKDNIQKRYADILPLYNPEFTFIVELEKPVEDNTYTQEELMEDTAYILKMVKPAHTIGLLYLILSGSENWKAFYNEKYNADWHYMDDPGFGITIDRVLKEGIYGWRAIDYDAGFHTSPQEDSGIYSNQSLINGGALVGPRYVLFDTSKLHSEKTIDDVYFNNKLYEELIQAIGNDATEEYNKYQAQLQEISTVLAEPRFGFCYNKYMQLSGTNPATKTINNYQLLGTGNCRLKDETLIEQNQFFSDKYRFASLLHAIQFTTPYGIGKHFGEESNIITEWKTYLQEHPFKETLDNGQIVTRIYDDLNILLDNFIDQFKAVTELETRDVILNEHVYISDDPLSSFRLNYPHETNQGINHHKLGPNKREKIAYGEYMSELYNQVNDHLPAYMATYFSDIYDKSKVTESLLEFYPEITYTDQVDSLIDNYLRLNLPVELAPIQQAFETVIDITPVHSSEFADHYREYLGSEDIINVLKSLAAQYNQTIDFDSPNIKQWINSARGTLRTPNSGQISLLRPFIRKKTEHYSFGNYIVDRYFGYSDKTTLFSAYLNEKFNTQLIAETEATKQVGLSDEIIVHDRPLSGWYENPLYFVSNELASLSRFNYGYFYTNKAALAETIIDGSGYSETFSPVTERQLYRNLYTAEIRTKPFIETELPREIINNDLYILNDKKPFQFNSSKFNYGQFNQNQGTAITDWKISGTGTYEQFNPVKDLPVYNPYLDEIKYEAKDETEQPRFLDYSEDQNISEFGVFRLNMSALNKNRFIKRYQSAIGLAIAQFEEFKRAVEYNTFCYFYQDNYIHQEDMDSLRGFTFNSIYNDTYYIPDEDKNYRFNAINGRLISQRTQQVSTELFTNEQQFKITHEDIFACINEYIDKYQREISDKSTFGTYYHDNFYLVNNETDNTTFNSKLKRFIKKNTELYTFNPLFNEYYDKKVTDGLAISPEYAEKYEEIKEELIDNSAYLVENCVIYDDEKDATTFNSELKQFIKYRTAVYTPNVWYFDPYNGIPTEDYYHNTIDNLENEIYDKAKDLSIVLRDFSDQFILYDNENVATRYNSKLKQFIKYTTALYTFNPEYNEQYSNEIHELISSVINSTETEIIKPAKDLAEAGTYFNDQFILYDNEKEATRFDSKLKKFIKYYTTLYRFNPEYSEIYDKTIYESCETKIVNKEEDTYTGVEDLLITSTHFNDKFYLYSNEEEATRLNHAQKKFIKYNTELYRFYITNFDTYNISIFDTRAINSYNIYKDKYSAKNDISEFTTKLSEQYILFDDENALHLNDKNNKYFIGHRTAVYGFASELNDKYKFNIVDSYMKQVMNSTMDEIYNAKDDSPELQTYLADTYLLYDEENALHLNYKNSKRFLGHRAAVYSMASEARDIYNVDIYDDFISNLKNTYTDKYSAKSDSSTSLGATLTDNYILFDDENALHLNDKNNKYFIGSRTAVYSISTELLDEYSNKIFESYKHNVNKQNNDEYKRGTDSVNDLAAGLSDKYLLFDDENALHLNDKNNKYFIGHRTAVYGFTSYLQDKYYKPITDQAAFISNNISNDEYKAKNDDTATFSSLLKEHYLLYDDENALQLNDKNNKYFIGHRTALYTMGCFVTDIYNASVNVYDYLFFNSKHNFVDKYEAKDDKSSKSQKTFTSEHYYPFDEDNPRYLKLRPEFDDLVHANAQADLFVSLKKFLGQFRMSSINPDLLKSERYDKEIIATCEFIPNTLSKETFGNVIDTCYYSKLTFTDSYLFNKDPLRLGYLNNRPFIGTNTKLIAWQTYHHDVYDAEIIDTFARYANKYAFDQFNAVKDDNYATAINFNEEYNLIKQNYLQLNDKNNHKFIGRNAELLTVLIWHNEVYNKSIFDDLSFYYGPSYNDKYEVQAETSSANATTNFSEYINISTDYLKLNELNNKQFISKIFDKVLFYISYSETYGNDIIESELQRVYNAIYEERINNYDERYLAQLKIWNKEEYDLYEEFLNTDIKINIYNEIFNKAEDKFNTFIVSIDDKFKPVKEAENAHLINAANTENVAFTNYKVFQFNQTHGKLMPAERAHYLTQLYKDCNEYFKHVEEKYKRSLNYYQSETFKQVNEQTNSWLKLWISENYEIKHEYYINNIWHLEEFNPITENSEVEILARFDTEIIPEPKDENNDAELAIEEIYYNLNIDAKALQFNKMRLNLSKFKANSNEIYMAELCKNDKYNPQSIEEDSSQKEVTALETMPTPQTGIIDIEPSIFEENIHHIALNPFKFVSSRFNLQQFMYNDLVDNATFSTENRETIKKPLLMLNHLSLNLTEFKFADVKGKSQITMRPFYNEVYNKYAESSDSFFEIQKDDKDSYELLSAVAYIQLEKIINNQYVTVKKSSYV